MKVLKAKPQFVAIVVIGMALIVFPGCCQSPQNTDYRVSGKLTETVDDAFSVKGGQVFDVTKKDFVFCYGKGSSLMGYKVYRLTNSGAAAYLGWQKSPDDASWLKWVDENSREQVDALLDELESNTVLKLKAEYHSNFIDAEQTIFIFQNDTQLKRIYCDGFVPKELAEFEAFVNANLVAHLIRHGDLSSTSRVDAKAESLFILWPE